MKAAVYTQYGPPQVLHLKEVETPSPGTQDILIRIQATAVNSGDWRLRKADPFAVRFIFGFFKPKKQILGSVFSGVVEHTGAGVTQFKVGDEVFGHTDMNFGAYAEFICLPEDASIALKPDSLSHREAAVIPFGGVTALHYLKKAQILPGAQVLVIGASGAVGSAAVQLAKAMGASVTGVCSTANMALVASMGADAVIDYTHEDFTKNGKKYDVIYDTVHSLSVKKGLPCLTPNGKLLLGAAGIPDMIQGAWASRFGAKKVLTGVIQHTSADMRFLKEQVEAGAFQPILDRTYPLERIAEAHAYVEQGHKKGNVAIEI